MPKSSSANNSPVCLNKSMDAPHFSNVNPSLTNELFLEKCGAEASENNYAWLRFKAHYSGELREAFSVLLKSLSHLAPYWHIIKQPVDDPKVTEKTLADFIGYEEAHFMVLMELLGVKEALHKELLATATRVDHAAGAVGSVDGEEVEAKIGGDVSEDEGGSYGGGRGGYDGGRGGYNGGRHLCPTWTPQRRRRIPTWQAKRSQSRSSEQTTATLQRTRTDVLQ